MYYPHIYNQWSYDYLYNLLLQRKLHNHLLLNFAGSDGPGPVPFSGLGGSIPPPATNKGAGRYP